jgi:hypothetical protein
MTVVAVWHEKYDDFLWAVADTRISVPCEQGHIKTTDRGVKIFALPVVCSAFADNGSVERIPYFSTTYGFAFAGDVLSATTTYATASTLLQELTTSGAKVPPSLNEVGELVRRIAERISREVMASSNGRRPFEAAIFGFNPCTQSFEIFHLRPRVECNSFEMVLTKVAPTSDGELILTLGTGKERLDEQLAQMRARGRDGHGRTVRFPKSAIEILVAENVGDVGGSMSIASVNRSGFRAYFSVRKQPDTWVPQTSFNGIDLGEDVGMVGPCFIGMPGIA